MRNVIDIVRRSGNQGNGGSARGAAGEGDGAAGGGGRLGEDEEVRDGAGASERLALRAQQEGDGRIVPSAENGEDEGDIGEQPTEPRPRRPVEEAVFRPVRQGATSEHVSYRVCVLIRMDDLCSIWCDPLQPTFQPRGAHAAPVAVAEVLEPGVRGPRGDVRRRVLLHILGRRPQPD